MKHVPATIKAQRLYADALERFVETPLMADGGVEWAVRAQFVLKTPSETRYFPVPAVKDPTRFELEYAKAEFEKTSRPFWADEQRRRSNNV